MSAQKEHITISGIACLDYEFMMLCILRDIDVLLTSMYGVRTPDSLQLTNIRKSNSQQFIHQKNMAEIENTNPELPPPSLMAKKFLQLDVVTELEEDCPFEQRLFFFYGTLTDPELLTQVLNRSEKPELAHAVIRDHGMSYWGDYPAAVQRNADHPIDGVICKIESDEELELLEAYETDMYRVDTCTAWLDDGTEICGSLFVWDGDESLLRESRKDITQRSVTGS